VDLEGAVLRDANLANAVMGNRLDVCTLQGADLTGTVLTNVIYDHKTRWPAAFDPTRHGAHALVPRADLRGLDLDEALLWDEDLTEANMEGASMQYAHLDGAMLRHANLRSASLNGAFLEEADMCGADLRRANLQGAYLTRGITERGASLAGADLRGADLTGAHLTGARYDARTRWPRGFDPKQHGAVRVNQ
jgi:uncharacterized protein YjbI with pentapeptide repeats